MPWQSRERKGSSDGEYVASNGRSRRCMAYCRSTGNRCRQWAIPGCTVCKYHGGRVGRYDDAIKNQALRDKYKQQVADKQLTDLEDDLALLRAMTEVIVERAFPADADVKDIPADRIGVISTLLEKVTKLVDSITKHQLAKGQLVSIQSMTRMVDTMTLILQRHIPDQELLRRIVADMTTVTVEQGDAKCLPSTTERGSQTDSSSGIQA